MNATETACVDTAGSFDGGVVTTSCIPEGMLTNMTETTCVDTGSFDGGVVTTPFISGKIFA